ncbi:putative signal transduction protein with EAL and GGDEF domain [Bradyrhizobium sp. USDA 4472]
MSRLGFDSVGSDWGALAEGVETTRRLDFLRGEGCDSVQGYLFGRPMPVGVVTRMIEEEKASRPQEADAREQLKSVAAA